MRINVKALLFLAGAVLFWGTSFAVTKSAYAVLSPMAVAWLRMSIAFIAFLPLLPRVKRPDHRKGDAKLLVLIAFFLPCLYFLLEGFAIRYTTSSQAGVVSAVMPLIVAVGGWVVLRERPGSRTVVAVVVSILGVAGLSLGGTSQASAPNPVLGNLLELGAMAAAAGATLTISRLSARYDPLLITGIQMGAGALFFAPLAFASGPIDWAGVSVAGWGGVAYLGIGCGLAAFALYNSALRMLPPARAALTINLVPAVALVTGWLALGETMSALQIVSCVVIVGAVVYAEARPAAMGRTEADPATESRPAETPTAS